MVRDPPLGDDGRVIDLLLRNARLAGRTADSGTAGRYDITIDAGRIVDIVPASDGAPNAREVTDLDGRLVTAPLVEPHIHLDAALTVGQPRPNVSRSLFEGIAVWAERIKDLTYDDVQSRVRQILRWHLANGVLYVRSHVDVCDPELRALRALVDVRQEMRGLIELQLVAFPQQSMFGFDGGTDLMRKAVGLGADVVGGIPHYELTREDGVESVKFAMALADEHGLRVDIHCDETDDDHSRFVEVMAAETIRRGMSGRVTASHTTAMHSYNNAYAYRLIANIARAGLHMVTNPLDNAVLQGRFDSGPIRRGHTRVKQLQEAGVNVCIGHDSVMAVVPARVRRPVAGRVRAGASRPDVGRRRVAPAHRNDHHEFRRGARRTRLRPTTGWTGEPGGLRRTVGGGRSAFDRAADARATRRPRRRASHAGAPHDSHRRYGGAGHVPTNVTGPGVTKAD
jgi:cytosine/creatinine deaminase